MASIGRKTEERRSDEVWSKSRARPIGQIPQVDTRGFPKQFRGSVQGLFDPDPQTPDIVERPSLPNADNRGRQTLKAQEFKDMALEQSAEFEKLKLQYTALQQRYKNLKGDRTNDIAAVNSQLNTLRTQLEYASKYNKDTENLLEIREQQIKRLEASRPKDITSQMESNILNLTEENKDLETRLSTLLAEIKQYRETTDKSLAAAALDAEALEAITEERDDALSELNRNNRVLVQSKRLIEDAQAKQRLAEEQAFFHITQLEQLTAQNNELTAQNNELTAQNTDLIRQHAIYEAEQNASLEKEPEAPVLSIAAEQLEQCEAQRDKAIADLKMIPEILGTPPLQFAANTQTLGTPLQMEQTVITCPALLEEYRVFVRGLDFAQTAWMPDFMNQMAEMINRATVLLNARGSMRGNDAPTVHECSDNTDAILPADLDRAAIKIQRKSQSIHQ